MNIKMSLINEIKDIFEESEKNFLTLEEMIYLGEKNCRNYIDKNFTLLNGDDKKVVISLLLDKDVLNLEQLDFFLKNFSSESIKEFFMSMILQGNDFEDVEMQLLYTEQKFLWYELLYKNCIKENDIEYWNKYYLPDFNLLKSQYREQQINSILE